MHTHILYVYIYNVCVCLWNVLYVFVFDNKIAAKQVDKIVKRFLYDLRNGRLQIFASSLFCFCFLKLVVTF